MTTLSPPARQLLGAMTSTSRRYRVTELAARADLRLEAAELAVTELRNRDLARVGWVRRRWRVQLTAGGKLAHHELLGDYPSRPVRPRSAA